MTGDNKRKSIKRRSVLKGMGAAGAAGLGIASVGTASAGAAEKKKFVGYTYNPITNEVGMPVSANLTRTPVGISGVLKLPERNVPVAAQGTMRQDDFPGSKSPHLNSKRLLFKQKLGGQFMLNETPLTVTLLSGNGVTGYVTNNGYTPRETFLLRDVKMHGTAKKAREAAKAIIGPTQDVPERIVVGGDQ